ncbi:MAG TPA: MFS transporter [Candidatus Dietzia intestinigallinarum]|nr:MFS transporter [Candidatus Dietzia intestinigallinarum]
MTPGSGRPAVLRNRVFRALLAVQLVNAVAVWIHVVAVQWVLTERGELALVISLAPAALAVPFLLLSMPAGVIAGYASRKKLMAGATSTSAVAAGAACVFSATGHDQALVMVLSVLLVGIALVLVGVSWQSLLPETVERASIPAAAVVDGAVFNVARALGPLIAGVGLGLAGAVWTFALVALLSAGCAVALLASERRDPDRTAPRRPILPELAGAVRFIAYSAWTTRLLCQLVLFGVPSSALWALISLVAYDRMGLSSDGFGVIMGLVGAGAVAAAFTLGGLRRRLRVRSFAALGAATYGAVLLVLGISTSPVVVGVAVLLAGAAWVSVQSTWMSMGHQFFPEWIRPRLIAVILLVFQGTQAIGALLWGAATDALGLQLALVIAAALLAASAVSLRVLGLGAESGIEPVLFAEHGGAVATPPPEGREVGGRAAVEVRYRYELDDNDDEFVAAMRQLRRSRLRLGGRDWRLDPEPDRAGVYVESYVVSGHRAFEEQELNRLTVPEARLRERVRRSVRRVSGPEFRERARR